jgi:glycosyltransferase involved in cell wall biosynthesis
MLDLVTAKRTSVFHAISCDVCQVMTKRLLIDPRRVVIAYRGRDEVRLGRRGAERRGRVRASLGIGEDVPVVLVVGRLDRQKAIDVALKGFAQFRASVPEARMLVVGRDGNAADVVREVANAVPDATLLGHRSDVPDLMCAADCLAFPSRWEGLGGTLIEALALELPIVASDIGPIREVLGGIRWPLVPVDEPRALAEGLSAVLGGRVDTPRLVAEGRRRFEELFTADAAAAQMQAIYERALEGRTS